MVSEESTTKKEYWVNIPFEGESYSMVERSKCAFRGRSEDLESINLISLAQKRIEVEVDTYIVLQRPTRESKESKFGRINTVARSLLQVDLPLRV